MAKAKPKTAAIPDDVVGTNGSTNGYLSRDDILAYDDLRTEELTVPMWGGRKIFLRTIPSHERDAFDASVLDQRDDGKAKFDHKNFRAKFAVKVIIDKDGARMFRDQDADALGAKSAAALSLIYDKASKLNRMTDEDAAELVGNSEGGRGD